MLRRILTRGIAALSIAFLGLGAVVETRADMVTYHVNVDTTGLAGTTGALEFQFNAGGTDAFEAVASIPLVTGGLPAGTATDTGGASGTLPGPLAIDNFVAGSPSSFNDIFQGTPTGAFLYTSSFSFDVTLSGPAVGTPPGSSNSGSTFALTLFSDAAGTTNLGTGPAGESLDIDVNPDGTTTPTTFNPVGGPTVTVTLATVPEPASLIQLGLGLGALVGWWGRSRRRRAA